MNATTLKLHYLLFALPIGILTFSIFVLHSQLGLANPQIFVGVTYDMVFLVPLTYFFAIRKTKIPTITVISVFVISYWLAKFFIPDAQQMHLGLIGTYVFPFIELGVISLVGYKSFQIVKTFKNSSQTDILATLESTTTDVFGKNLASKLLAAELTIFYYALIDWKNYVLKDNEFSYHKENGSLGLWGALIFLIFVETAAIHLLVMQWSEVVAWVLFLLSTYTGLQFFAHAKAIKKRPIRLDQDLLSINNGLFGKAIIPLNQIEKVEMISNFEATSEQKAVFMSLLGEMESYNIAIYLKNEIAVEKLYGLKQKTTIILLHIDDKERFLRNFAA